MTRPLQSSSTSQARVIAITSGKGGVGKTFVSSNLAYALAKQGKRVLVLDADLGLANLDVVLNLQPKVTLHDVFTGKVSIHDAIIKAPGGFFAVFAGSGLVEYSRLTQHIREQMSQIMKSLSQQFDYVILDTGAGISDVVLYTVSLAQEVLMVVTPEPTSMTDAYATIKVLTSQQQRDRFKLLVNQVNRSGESRKIQGQLQQVVDRFVSPMVPGKSVQLVLAGEVPLDKTARDAILKRQLLMEHYPQCPAANAIHQVALTLIKDR
jgi:flagellar biosynthesis protein FlhG